MMLAFRFGRKHVTRAFPSTACRLVRQSHNGSVSTEQAAKPKELIPTNEGPIMDPSPMEVRSIAAVLMEFMMPACRHPLSLGKQKGVGEILRKEKFQKRQLYQRFQNSYRSPIFENYIKAGNYTLHVCCLSFQKLLRLLNIPFEIVAREYRRCHAVVDWIYTSKRSTAWLGNPTLRRVGIEWVAATDELRRRALRQPDKFVEECQLTRMYVDSLGKDYFKIIEKRLKRLVWLCEGVFLVKDSYYKKMKFYLNMNRCDAKYMLDLYSLKSKLKLSEGVMVKHGFAPKTQRKSKKSKKSKPVQSSPHK